MSKITHLLAVAGAAGAAFIASPAGMAIVHQYPIISPILAAIGAVVLAYHNPKVAQ